MKISSAFLFLLFAWQLPGQAPSHRKSHIDDLIAGARARVAQTPPRAEAYNDLANALARRAREMSDASYLRQAEEAVNQSLRIAPANFEARKARVVIRLQESRYADALEEAQALNKQVPDDNIMYGLITDAQLGLGNYAEAEAATQRMIDLRQVSSPGLQHGAKVREAIGYVEGALDWWNSSMRLASATDEEERAFVLVQMARLSRENGKADVAARYAEQAMALVPAYPRGLTELALDRLAEDKPAAAVDLLKQRLALAKDLDSLYWLGKAMRAAGSGAESKTVLADFEKQALAASGRAGNADILLIAYEAESGNAAAALRIAKENVARRHDSETLDAYAWALYSSGDYAAASEQEKLALAPGERNARFFYHAGVIARKNGDAPAALKYFRKSLEVNSGSEESVEAMREIAASKPSGS